MAKELTTELVKEVVSEDSGNDYIELPVQKMQNKSDIPKQEEQQVKQSTEQKDILKTKTIENFESEETQQFSLIVIFLAIVGLLVGFTFCCKEICRKITQPDAAKMFDWPEPADAEE